MFTPTHRHADGGFYQHIGPQKGKSSDGPDKWIDGQAYCNSEGMMFWTDDDRWAHRFEELPTDRFKDTEVLELKDEEGVLIASYVFNVEDVGDARAMFISAANVAAKQRDHHVETVLRAQADMISQNLHVRDTDFPDMIGDVNAFHAKFGQEYTGKPRILPADLFNFRVKFHDEETGEYADEQENLEDAIQRRDRRDIINCLELQLDALCDAAWVILGTADLQFGRRPFIEAWRRVVKANMAKVLATADPDAQDSGREAKYDIRKPKGWVAPDHRDLVLDNAIFDDIFTEPEEPVESNTFNEDASRYSDTRSI